MKRCVLFRRTAAGDTFYQGRNLGDSHGICLLMGCKEQAIDIRANISSCGAAYSVRRFLRTMRAGNLISNKRGVLRLHFTLPSHAIRAA